MPSNAATIAAMQAVSTEEMIRSAWTQGELLEAMNDGTPFWLWEKPVENWHAHNHDGPLEGYHFIELVKHADSGHPNLPALMIIANVIRNWDRGVSFDDICTSVHERFDHVTRPTVLAALAVHGLVTVEHSILNIDDPFAEPHLILVLKDHSGPDRGRVEVRFEAGEREEIHGWAEALYAAVMPA